MNSIVLQPCGNKDGREHYIDTIENKVSINKLKPYLKSNQIADLEDIYKNGECAIWGVTSSGNNLSKWKRISIGDVTLFSRNGHIINSGVTTYKLKSKKLAAYLWDYNKNGLTWENIYFLDEIKNQKIPYSDFNRVVGYKENYIIQGFSVLNEEKSIKLFNEFDFESDLHLPDLDEQKIKDVILELESTDSIVTTNRRLEQGYHKKNLFGYKKVFSCGICNKEYPVSFLVAAHIKKRKHCSHNERLDKNIIMPMCRFGCDELYERGYITVINGKVKKIKNLPTSRHLDWYIENIVNENCYYFNEYSKKYFAWHVNFHTN